MCSSVTAWQDKCLRRVQIWKPTGSQWRPQWRTIQREQTAHWAGENQTAGLSRSFGNTSRWLDLCCSQGYTPSLLALISTRHYCCCFTVEHYTVYTDYSLCVKAAILYMMTHPQSYRGWPHWSLVAQTLGTPSVEEEPCQGESPAQIAEFQCCLQAGGQSFSETLYQYL